MNEFIRLTKITQSVHQERRDTITAFSYTGVLINNDYVVKTNITNKSCLVIKSTKTQTLITKCNTKSRHTTNQLTVTIEFNHYNNVKTSLAMKNLCCFNNDLEISSIHPIIFRDGSQKYIIWPLSPPVPK